MLEIPWATPQAIGKLTLPQLLCLSNERPPNQKQITSPEEYARIEREEAEGWQ